MFFNSSGLPNWHHPTATSPSKTSAAWARPSRMSRSLSARLASYENSFSAWKVWNHVHQHPPHTPLCRSARPANASHVSGVRGRTVSVAAASSVTGHSLKETGPCQAQGALRNTGPRRSPVLARRCRSEDQYRSVGGECVIGDLVEGHCPALRAGSLPRFRVAGRFHALDDFLVVDRVGSVGCEKREVDCGCGREPYSSRRVFGGRGDPCEAEHDFDHR